MLPGGCGSRTGPLTAIQGRATHAGAPSSRQKDMFGHASSTVSGQAQEVGSGHLLRSTFSAAHPHLYLFRYDRSKPQTFVTLISTSCAMTCTCTSLGEEPGQKNSTKIRSRPAEVLVQFWGLLHNCWWRTLMPLGTILAPLLTSSAHLSMVGSIPMPSTLDQESLRVSMRRSLKVQEGWGGAVMAVSPPTQDLQALLSTFILTCACNITC